MRKSEQAMSILVIRHGAIGDLIMSSPVAETLKLNNPNATIAWLVEPEYADLISSNPYIDQVIEWDRKHWKKLWKKFQLRSLYKEIKSIALQLRSSNYLYALDLQGTFKSGLLTWLTKAPHRICLNPRESSHWFMTQTVTENIADKARIGSSYRHFMDHLNFQHKSWKMQAPLNKDALDSSKKILAPLIQSQSYTVICPFTTRPQKRWPMKHWQQLTLRVRGKYQLRTIVLGGEEDFEEAEQLARLCGAINLAGKTTLMEASAIIKNANIVIGVDTGLTHMSHAFDVPSITLFGSTYPFAFSEKENSRVIFSNRPCSPCNKNPTCGGLYQCMSKISPDKVLSELKPLITASSISALAIK